MKKILAITFSLLLVLAMPLFALATNTQGADVAYDEEAITTDSATVGAATDTVNDTDCTVSDEKSEGGGNLTTDSATIGAATNTVNDTNSTVSDEEREGVGNLTTDSATVGAATNTVNDTNSTVSDEESEGVGNLTTDSATVGTATNTVNDTNCTVSDEKSEGVGNLTTDSATVGAATNTVNDTNSTVSDELSQYIKDKILPIIVGVITSISALLATLGGIFKSLSSLKGTKEMLSEDAESRRTSHTALLTQLREQGERVQELKDSLAPLETEIGELSKKCTGILRVLEMGFLENGDIVKSGKGREIATLISALGVVTENVKVEKTGDGVSEL